MSYDRVYVELIRTHKYFLFIKKYLVSNIYLTTFLQLFLISNFLDSEPA